MTARRLLAALFTVTLSACAAPATTPSPSGAPASMAPSPAATPAPGATASTRTLTMDGEARTVSEAVSGASVSAGAGLIYEVSVGDSNTGTRVTLSITTKDRPFKDPAARPEDVTTVRLAVVSIEGGLKSWQQTFTGDIPAGLLTRSGDTLSVRYEGKLNVLFGGGQGQVAMDLRGIQLP